MGKGQTLVLSSDTDPPNFRGLHDSMEMKLTSAFSRKLTYIGYPILLRGYKIVPLDNNYCYTIKTSL